MIETQVSKGIISTYFDKLQRNLNLDVAIVGGGPSGIVAAYYLAKARVKVAQFDRKLSPGGGMWGGAMMFNQIVIQEEAMHIIKDFDINYEARYDFRWKDQFNLSLDPERALEYYKSSNSVDANYCTMCGPNFCAARISHSLKNCNEE